MAAPWSVNVEFVFKGESRVRIVKSTALTELDAYLAAAPAEVPICEMSICQCALSSFGVTRQRRARYDRAA